MVAVAAWEAFEDRPLMWDAWDIDSNYVDQPVELVSADAAGLPVVFQQPVGQHVAQLGDLDLHAAIGRRHLPWGPLPHAGLGAVVEDEQV